MSTTIAGRDRLTVLRALFLVLVAFATATSLASGQSLFPSMVVGFVHGGLSFVAVVLLFLVYVGGKTVLSSDS